MKRLAAPFAITVALTFAGQGGASAQTPAAAERSAPLTLDDILEQAAEAEAQAEPSEEEAETNGLPAAPIPYNSITITADDLDRRMRGTSAAAQTLQGPLDGRWSLATLDGAPLYVLLFVDSGRGALEGAWRDVTRGAGLTATGVISTLSRDGAALSAVFSPRPGETVSLTLSQQSDSAWSGDLDEGGRRRGVRLMRDEPLLAVAPVFGASGVVSPYRTSATRPAAARPAVRKAAVKKKAVAKKKAPAKKRVVRKKT